MTKMFAFLQTKHLPDAGFRFVLRKATGNPDKLFSVVVLVYPSVSFTLLFHFK